MNAQRQSVHHVIAPCHHHAITPCHHVIIMSQQFGVGAVEQSDTSGAHEFAGENTLERETLFLKDNVAPGVAEVGSLFPRVRGSIWDFFDKKCTGLWRKFGLHCKTLKKLSRSEPFWKMRPAKCAEDWREFDLHLNMPKKSLTVPESPGALLEDGVREMCTRL